MRIRHLFISAVPVLVLLVTSLSAEAQYGGPIPSAGPVFYNGSPGYGGTPGYSGMPGAAAPPQFLPNPMISPYDNMLDETYNSNGMWFRNQMNGFGPYNRPRDWFFNLDYTRTRTRKLNGTVGADNVQTYAQQVDPENDQVVDDMSFYPYFDSVPASVIPRLANNGIRLNGGFWNVDGTGLMFNVGWSADSSATFDARAAVEATRLPLDQVLSLRRNGGLADAAPFNLNGLTDLFITENFLLAPGTVFDAVGNQTFAQAPNFGTTFEILDRTVMNLYGLPIQLGPDPLNPSQGVTLPYDLQFIMQHRLNTIGSNLDWAFAPIYDRGGVTVRPVFGGRYFRIDEGFAFFGKSTLLSYNDNGDNDTPANAKVFPVGNGIDDDDDFIVDNPFEDGDQTFIAQEGANNLIVTSTMDATVISNLAGPEIGFHYELGDKRGIRLSGSTRLGAMANSERIRINGDNIGDFTTVTTDLATNTTQLTTMFDTDNSQGPTQNAFADSRNTTHISPLFEQAINAELPLFTNVPVLRDISLLEDAKLNVGWTFLLIGGVADPQESINWTSSPRFGVTPTVSPDRSTFFQNTVNVGINWNY